MKICANLNVASIFFANIYRSGSRAAYCFRNSEAYRFFDTFLFFFHIFHYQLWKLVIQEFDQPNKFSPRAQSMTHSVRLLVESSKTGRFNPTLFGARGGKRGISRRAPGSRVSCDLHSGEFKY